MAHIIPDRVRDTSTTTGTDAFTLSGAAPSTYRTFASVCANNDTIWYVAVHRSANEWEVGLGTSNGSTGLTRTQVFSGSNGTSPVNFSAGTKDIIAVNPANNILKEGTTADYLANVADRFLSTDQVNASGALQTLTDSSNLIAFDMSLGFNAQITMDGNHTLSNPTNTIVGRTGAIVFTQDGTGNRTLAYGTNWEAAGGSGGLPVLSTAAGAKDIIFYWIQSSTSIVITGCLKAVA